MRYKYTVKEVGKGETWHIWDNEHHIFMNDDLFGIFQTKEQAELVCKLLNEHEESLPKADKRENNKCYYKHETLGYIRINHEDGDFSELCRNKVTGYLSDFCRCTQ